MGLYGSIWAHAGPCGPIENLINKNNANAKNVHANWKTIEQPSKNDRKTVIV